MANLTNTTPFSELTEKAMSLARDNTSTSRDKFKGLVNRAYTQEIPRKEDWAFLKGSSSVSCTARYNTGTISATAGSTSVTGSGTTWTTAMTGRKIKIGSNENIYSFTYVSATTATISPAYSGAVDASGSGYVIYDDDYAMASDFDRFIQGGTLYKYRSGRPYILDDCSFDDKKWNDEFYYSPSDETRRFRLRGFDSSMYRVVEINPPPQNAIALQYDYIKALIPMTEYRTGTITTLANGGTAVTGSGTDFDGYGSSSYTYYLRIDRDGVGDSSVWYKISSFDSDTAITLDSAYAGTSISSGIEEYTISMIPLLPYSFHDWILYLACVHAAIDENDPVVKGWIVEAQAIEKECRRLYKSRNPNTDIDVEC